MRIYIRLQFTIYYLFKIIKRKSNINLQGLKYADLDQLHNTHLLGTKFTYNKHCSHVKSSGTNKTP